MALFGVGTGDTRLVDWFEQAEAAERLQDWDMAIALVSAHAECCSSDPDMHDNHLWHMDLLARAERIPELTERALTDVHARRRKSRTVLWSCSRRPPDGRGSGPCQDPDAGAAGVLVT
jgi:hypothetical protein